MTTPTGATAPSWPPQQNLRQSLITSAIIKDLASSVLLQSQSAVAKVVQLCVEIVSVGC